MMYFNNLHIRERAYEFRALLAMTEAPVEEPETIPDTPTAPQPNTPAPAPDTDPFNPSWPDGRPEPQPKALSPKALSPKALSPKALS